MLYNAIRAPFLTMKQVIFEKKKLFANFPHVELHIRQSEPWADLLYERGLAFLAEKTVHDTCLISRGA
jgi:hypothetical protein